MDKRICEKKCHKKDKCGRKTFIIPEEPLTLIQNVSQNIDSNGQLMNFQNFNKTKFARLLPDSHSIKIRKTGTYILTLNGTIKWNNLNGNILSFALLKNGVPLTETIQNRSIPVGINKFDETVNRNFTFNRGDILTFEVESFEPATSFVPSIIVEGNTFYGNGLTLIIQSLRGQNVPVIIIDTTRYNVEVAYFNDVKCVYVFDNTKNIGSFCYVEDIDEIEKYISDNTELGNLTYVVSFNYTILNNDYYVTQLFTQSGTQSLRIICDEPYILASQLFNETF